MKKTSLRKNRFAAQATRLPRNPLKFKLSRKLQHSRAIDRKKTTILMAEMMDQWGDADIAERMAATLSRPISPEAQAFYDHVDAVLEGRASIGDPLKPVVGEAA
ncbi:hypothetical protein [Massilia rubra]|uniref:Uncharacterized protein n=1 Tax=Massilia rubra TaxID=2607910 RepID=A0ABX0LKM7_9BURK|nr:hypothetical protein [Massilia rubra]NHZ33198.1 hypothetical protein [Massilia rubra]